MRFAVALAILAGLGAVLACLVRLIDVVKRRRFADAATKLGLTLSGDGLSMAGSVRGLPVHIVWERRENGFDWVKRPRRLFEAEEHYEHADVRTREPRYDWFTRVRVDVPASIPADFRIRGVGRLSRLAAMFSDQREWALGAPDVERHFDFDAEAIDVERMREMVRQTEVLEALRALRGSAFAFQLEGTTLFGEARGRLSFGSALVDGATQLVTLGKALIDAQSRVLTAAERCQRDWTPVARAQGLKMVGARMEGSLRGAAFSMELVSAGAHDRSTRATLTFDRSLADSLGITRAGALERVKGAIGLHDLHTGDATFDDHFRVEGEPPETVRRILSPEVRAALLSLSSLGALEVSATEATLTVDDVVAAEALASLLTAFAELVTALAPPAQGAFR